MCICKLYSKDQEIVEYRCKYALRDGRVEADMYRSYYPPSRLSKASTCSAIVEEGSQVDEDLLENRCT